MYWWENPYPKYDAGTPWRRHVIKDSGGKKHHDQVVGDFDGDGKAELVFWNQGAKKLFLARIPADSKNSGPWPLTEIFSWSAGELEGLAKADIDGDGKLDLAGGGRWFRHEGGAKFAAQVIDERQGFSRAAAGRLLKNSRGSQVVFVTGDGSGRLKWYEQRGGTWQGRDLLGFDVVHGHSLQVADIDDDGNLDIFCSEMAKWTRAPAADNPAPHMWIFYGDGKGNFRKIEIANDVANHESKIADLDGDGRLDILGKPHNWDTPRIDVWLNLGRARKR